MLLYMAAENFCNMINTTNALKSILYSKLMGQLILAVEIEVRMSIFCPFFGMFLKNQIPYSFSFSLKKLDNSARLMAAVS